MQTYFTINNLILSLNIGLFEEERATPQPISISVKIFFKDIPKGCVSDEIEGTICYDKICQKIKEIANKKEYKLLEHLCHEIFIQIKQLITPHKISVSVTKLTPPVSGLESASFSIES